MRSSEFQGENPVDSITLHSKAINVPYKAPDCHKKQVSSGRLHMRPVQWHLKTNWQVPESLEKQIPIPNSLHNHLW